ncbi:MAG: DUF1501 domain-containing protein [Fimbriimonadaceae bacterium]|nr:DUF1501 domain-containing protein [Fimbriimonadaceae bacterium]
MSSVYRPDYPRHWIACDGGGDVSPVRPSAPVESTAPPTRESAGGVTRRGLLVGASMASLAWAARGSALAGFSVSPTAPKHVLVVVFLRGGADGLNFLVPTFEDRYYKVRPNIAVPARETLKLDDRFGLHPAFQSLEPWRDRGQLLGIHAVGSFDHSRSHFEAMSAMERGLATDGAGPASGWLGRYLGATHQDGDTPLRAVAFGGIMPDAMRGGMNAVAVDRISDFRLELDGAERAELVRQLTEMCADGKDAASEAGRDTLRVLKSIQQLERGENQPANGAKYPETGLGVGFRETAMLIRAGIGMEVAFLNMGGWDTHVAQGSTTGWMSGLLSELAEGLTAFGTDLGPDLANVTVIVKSEFGRRIYENGGLGTDHGRAGAMLVMGGGLAKRGVYADWPGLDPDQLDGPGDLRVTTDYRDVLAEVLTARHRLKSPTDVFPGHPGKRLGIFQG